MSLVRYDQGPIPDSLGLFHDCCSTLYVYLGFSGPWHKYKYGPTPIKEIFM